MIESNFDVTIIYDKLEDNGVTKKTKELYLVEAANCADAEARVTEEVKHYIDGEMKAVQCKEVKYSEILTGYADRYYTAKVRFITLDEKSGKEKAVTSRYLVNACTLLQALKAIEDDFKGSMTDYEVVSISETNYVGRIAE